LFKLIFLEEYQKQFRKYDKHKQQQIIKTVQLLKNNPRHPSLKSHWNRKRRAWQSKVNDSDRLLWNYRPGKKIITIIVVGDHSLVE